MALPNELPLRVAPEVAAARAAGGPVVALESTVIAHGLPWPDNLALARGLEAIVRAAGAVPATIAVLDGTLRVGLGDAELERIARDRGIPKASRRDLPLLVARGGDGATTVAGTIFAAHLAGIQVMATGGIGGVHRGDRSDVSADLPELARTPVLVVCSGAKAILDLPATLEWLETHGVPVLGWRTSAFPAFYCAESGIPLEARVEGAGEVAAMVRAAARLGTGAGVLLAVPCPAEAALPADVVQGAIAQALAEARGAALTGKGVTPFLLARVAELTGGASRAANLALLRRNAAVAAEVARALADPR